MPVALRGVPQLLHAVDANDVDVQGTSLVEPPECRRRIAACRRSKNDNAKGKPQEPPTRYWKTPSALWPVGGGRLRLFELLRSHELAVVRLGNCLRRSTSSTSTLRR